MKNGMTTVFLVAVAGFAIWAFSSAWEPLENSGDFVSSIVSSSASPPIRSGLGGESQAGPEAVQLRSVYDDAAAVLGSRSLSRQQKQDRVRVIQQNYGQGVLTAVIRHVPVYDEASGQMVTFDTYMRNMAGEYSYNSGAPVDLDPVGAALRIFFDPSTETVQSMTGIGMLEAEVAQASQQYLLEKRKSQSQLSGLVQAVESTLSGLKIDPGQVKQAFENAAETFSSPDDSVRRSSEETRQNLERSLERSRQQAADALRNKQAEVQRNLERSGQLAAEDWKVRQAEAQRAIEQSSREFQRSVSESLNRARDSISCIFGNC